MRFSGQRHDRQKTGQSRFVARLVQDEVGRKHIERRGGKVAARLVSAIALLHVMSEVGKDTRDKYAYLEIRLDNEDPGHHSISIMGAGNVSRRPFNSTYPNIQ